MMNILNVHSLLCYVVVATMARFNDGGGRNSQIRRGIVLRKVIEA